MSYHTLKGFGIIAATWKRRNSNKRETLWRDRVRAPKGSTAIMLRCDIEFLIAVFVTVLYRVNRVVPDNFFYTVWISRTTLVCAVRPIQVMLGGICFSTLRRHHDVTSRGGVGVVVSGDLLKLSSRTSWYLLRVSTLWQVLVRAGDEYSPVRNRYSHSTRMRTRCRPSDV